MTNRNYGIQRFVIQARTDSRIVGLPMMVPPVREEAWSDLHFAVFIRSADSDGFEKGWKAWAALQALGNFSPRCVMYNIFRFSRQTSSVLMMV
jgi:hypothetical protein